MNYLCISVTFLDGRFHGRGDHDQPEWPPSPWRLFQAMVAAANGMKKEAFEWFQRLPPPDILAPETRQTENPCKLYVPNNSSDVKRDGADRAEKVFQPLVIASGQPIHYLYKLDGDSATQAASIAETAKQVSTIGWGIDLTAVDAGIITKEQVEILQNVPECRRFRPLNKGNGHRLRVHMAGSFADLIAAHTSARNALDGLLYTFPRKAGTFREVEYRVDGRLARHSACFRLLSPEDEAERTATFDPRFVSHVSSWVRGCLCRQSSHGCVPDIDPEVYIAGHVAKSAKTTPPRFSYFPLPTIGHPHADGLVRRVIVAEPFGDDGIKANWAARILDCTQLTDENSEARAECRLADPHGPVFNEYTYPASCFETVTPVILPGFDDGRYAKAEKLFIKAFQQAGFPLDQLADFTLQRSPFRKSGCSLREYRRPKHLENFSAMHVRLVMRDEVQGPIALGAGRHRGLGLFAALTTEHQPYANHEPHDTTP